MIKMLFIIIAMLLHFSNSVFAQSQSLTSITFATDWKAQAEHGGFYQAVAKGYYKKYGLDVKIRPGGPQSDNPRLIAAGVLDIAMASNSFQPLNLLAAEADVKVIMASFQKDPQVMMVHPNVKATSLTDLKNRPMFIADSAVATFWPWLKAKFGYSDRQIRKYTYSLAPWLANTETVQEGYLSSEPYSAQVAGITPKVFLFADEGYPGYAGMVMVRGDYLEENRETVRRFVRASVEGWQDYIFNDPNAGNALILKDNPEMTAELLAYAHKAIKSNSLVGERDKIGAMSPERWQTFYQEMSDLNILPKQLDVTKAYTLEFLNAETRP